jgi:hypothetical protein
METEDLLPSSQEPTTGPYPEPNESSPFHTIQSYFSKIYRRSTDTQRYDIVNTVVLLYQTLLRSLHVSVHRTIIR